MWGDPGSGELHITLFFDTDWRKAVDGQLSAYTFQFGGGKWPAHANALDLSEDVEGVIIYGLTFQQEDNIPGYRGSPTLLISNMSGEPADVLKRAMRLQVDEQHFWCLSRGNRREPTPDLPRRVYDPGASADARYSSVWGR